MNSLFTTLRPVATCSRPQWQLSGRESVTNRINGRRLNKLSQRYPPCVFDVSCLGMRKWLSVAEKGIFEISLGEEKRNSQADFQTDKIFCWLRDRSTFHRNIGLLHVFWDVQIIGCCRKRKIWYDLGKGKRDRQTGRLSNGWNSQLVYQSRAISRFFDATRNCLLRDEWKVTIWWRGSQHYLDEKEGRQTDRQTNKQSDRQTVR